MKFLMIHNEYGTRSGEEIQFGHIQRTLLEHGQEVRTHIRSSREIPVMMLGKVQAFFAGIYNPFSRSRVGSLVRNFQPDIVFVQNLFPLISPSILPVCNQGRSAVVMRVANYRLMCPTGLHLSHGEVCERCLGGRMFWCALRNCEEDVFKSIGYALRSSVAQIMGWYKKNVSAFICASRFLKSRMIQAGFDGRKLHVLPNIVPDVPPPPAERGDAGSYVAYSGRLSREKGISVLLEAAKQCPDIPFRLAGSYAPSCRFPEALPPNVKLAGFLKGPELTEFYRGARFVMNASECFETFGMSMAEAMLHSKPVIASRLGVMTEFVKQDVSGLLFEPGNAKDLANQVRLLWGQPQRCIELGRAGRVWAQHEYAPESYYPRLMEICRSAILEKNRQSLSATSAWTGPAPRLSSSHAACPKAEPNRADRHSLRFLMVHNEYGKRSGEEVEFDCIRNLVEVRGHLTCSFLRSSKSVDQMLLGRERAFFSGLYSWRSRRDIGTALRQFDPDIVLVQNLYPWISPAVLPLCRRSRAGVVMLVANYRLMCPSGLHLRRGQICERCLGGREYQCAIRNCEEGLFKSLGYALRSAVARRAGWYKDSVSAYICASTFLKIRMIDAGFEERKLHVVPNVVLDVDYRPAPEGQLGEYVGYVGRLSREKGVSVLLEAARLCPDIPFALAGDCSPAFRLPEPLPPNVRLAGFISGTQLDEFYRNARLVVNSSQCFETFGMSIAEAMLHGKAVIASRLGVMPEFVRENLTGLLAEPGNPADLAARIGQLWSQPARCMELGRAGRTWALQEYSPQRYYSRFIEVCRGAILEKGGDVVGFDRMLREIGA